MVAVDVMSRTTKKTSCGGLVARRACRARVKRGSPASLMRHQAQMIVTRVIAGTVAGEYATVQPGTAAGRLRPVGDAPGVDRPPRTPND